MGMKQLNALSNHIKMKKIVIPVIIGLAISILMFSGCLTLEDTEEELEEALRLSVDDSYNDLENEGDYFTTADDLLKLEQTGGDPIDWTKYTIYAEVKDSGNRQELRVASVNGKPGMESRTGDVIVLRSTVNEHFRSGDYVQLIIIKGDAMVYKSTAVRIV